MQVSKLYLGSLMRKRTSLDRLSLAVTMPSQEELQQNQSEAVTLSMV